MRVEKVIDVLSLYDPLGWGSAMRGDDEIYGSLFSYIDLGLLAGDRLSLRPSRDHHFFSFSLSSLCCPPIGSSHEIGPTNVRPFMVIVFPAAGI